MARSNGTRRRAPEDLASRWRRCGLEGCSSCSCQDGGADAHVLAVRLQSELPVVVGRISVVAGRQDGQCVVGTGQQRLPPSALPAVAIERVRLRLVPLHRRPYRHVRINPGQLDPRPGRQQQTHGRHTSIPSLFPFFLSLSVF